MLIENDFGCAKRMNELFKKRGWGRRLILRRSPRLNDLDNTGPVLYDDWYMMEGAW